MLSVIPAGAGTQRTERPSVGGWAFATVILQTRQKMHAGAVRKPPLRVLSFAAFSGTTGRPCRPVAFRSR